MHKIKKIFQRLIRKREELFTFKTLRERKEQALILDPIEKSIVHYLKKNPGKTSKEISIGINIDESDVYNTIHKLLRLDLIEESVPRRLQLHRYEKTYQLASDNI
jgi:DNA-binding MarR family transcriptional regulator